MTPTAAGWTGAWVAERLGVRLRTTTSPFGIDLEDMVGLALRRNPRRAHLLVSRVLAKHVPTDPRLVRGAALLLGALVREVLEPGFDAGDDAERALLGSRLRAALDEKPGAAVDLRDAAAALLGLDAADQGVGAGVGAGVDALVLGYAETATALGHTVAEALGRADYLHSTRRPVDGVAVFGGFEEAHSHATSHMLLPSDPSLLTLPRPLVLVDDELSTGSTVLNTVAALHALAPRDRYVVATLVDLRSDADRDRMQAAVDALGATLDVVSLVSGAVDLPADSLARGADIVAGLTTTPTDLSEPAPPASGGRSDRVEVGWPVGLPEGGRHGIGPDDRAAWREDLPGLAGRLEGVPGRSVLVLGTEELMAAPLYLAEAWADARPDLHVCFSTTTRSPALAVDDAGYALRSVLQFGAHDVTAEVAAAPRFTYNVAGADGRPRFDEVVLVTDTPGDTAALTGPGGLVDALTHAAPDVRVVVLPVRIPREFPEPLHGPQFGSYAADEVTWLLKDLSDVRLEAPTAEREAAIQAGTAHYAESLPQEYQPDAEYQQLFHVAVAESAPRIAHAVGVVSEILLAERGPDLVLASLARAGTPIGILIRRWLAATHGLNPHHYTLSIVRGRGIDEVALQYLAARHRPRDVVFVDGWTGKGAIARELSAALAQHADSTGVRFDDDLAVLADPGHCVRTFGTRDDFLIPSACLNSTVSGLVSRTVLNDTLIGPGDFHGAKFYSELADGDVSNAYLDAVAQHFTAVRSQVDADWPAVAAVDRKPTWEGWAAVERISEQYGIGQVNLVKPGVGETTRVLLRRVPERVLVRAGAADELPHVLLLARQRGVPVEEVPDLPYSCVGLIRPHSGGEG